MADMHGTPLVEGDPILWHTATVDSEGEPDGPTLLRVVKEISDERYLVELYRDESDFEPPPYLQALFDQVNAALAQHGEGAGSLPIDSAFVVDGSEIEYFGEDPDRAPWLFDDLDEYDA